MNPNKKFKNVILIIVTILLLSCGNSFKSKIKFNSTSIYGLSFSNDGKNLYCSSMTNQSLHEIFILREENNNNYIIDQKIKKQWGYLFFEKIPIISNDNKYLAWVNSDIYISICKNIKNKYVSLQSVKDKKARIAGLPFGDALFYKFLSNSNNGYEFISGHTFADEFSKPEDLTGVINFWKYKKNRFINYQRIQLPEINNIFSISDNNEYILTGNSKNIFILKKSKKLYQLIKKIPTQFQIVKIILIPKDNYAIIMNSENILLFDLINEKIIDKLKITSKVKIMNPHIEFKLYNNFAFIIYANNKFNLFRSQDTSESIFMIVKIEKNKIQYQRYNTFDKTTISSIAIEPMKNLCALSYTNNLIKNESYIGIIELPKILDKKTVLKF